MQFLVITRRKMDAFEQRAFDDLVEAEMSCARKLYSIGFTRQIWHRWDAPGACQVVEANDEHEVRQRIETLPFASSGMMDIQIIPLAPYKGFC